VTSMVPRARGGLVAPVGEFDCRSAPDGFHKLAICLATLQALHEKLGQRLSGHDLTLTPQTEGETRRKRSAQMALSCKAVPIVWKRPGIDCFTFTPPSIRRNGKPARTTKRRSKRLKESSDADQDPGRAACAETVPCCSGP